MSTKSAAAFLDEAARLYSIQIPSFGAYLASQAHHDVSDIPARYPKSGVMECPGCCAMLIPGLNAGFHFNTQVPDWGNKNTKKDTVSQRQSSRGSKNPKTLSIDCKACHRYVKFNVERGSRCSGQANGREVAFRQSVNNAPLRPSSQLEGPSVANRSSKQRAKARRQGGLQAMLNETGKSLRKQPEPELSLMDILKKD